MRLASVWRADRPVAAVVRADRVLVGPPDLTLAGIITGGEPVLSGVRAWAEAAPDQDWLPLAGVELAPAIPDPGAIYTVGLNYRAPDEPPGTGPDRPLIYGKAASSVGADGTTLTWDRSVTANVDAECELGVVVGADGGVFGYTIIDDVSSRDPWLDGDQWLIGKSMPGFCPVGPVVVTADELDPADIALGCRINGVAIQDGRTRDMRFGIAEQIAYLGRHLTLRPGDLIATGTPPRLRGEYGQDRHLEPGDVVSCWIEGIGELTTHVT